MHAGERMELTGSYLPAMQLQKQKQQSLQQQLLQQLHADHSPRSSPNSAPDAMRFRRSPRTSDPLTHPLPRTPSFATAPATPLLASSRSFPHISTGAAAAPSSPLPSLLLPTHTSAHAVTPYTPSPSGGTVHPSLPGGIVHSSQASPTALSPDNLPQQGTPISTPTSTPIPNPTTAANTEAASDSPRSALPSLAPALDRPPPVTARPVPPPALNRFISLDTTMAMLAMNTSSPEPSPRLSPLPPPPGPSASAPTLEHFAPNPNPGPGPGPVPAPTAPRPGSSPPLPLDPTPTPPELGGGTDTPWGEALVRARQEQAKKVRSMSLQGLPGGRPKVQPFKPPASLLTWVESLPAQVGVGKGGRV